MYKLGNYLVLILIVTTSVVSKRYTRNKSGNGHFSDEQAALLQEIEVLAYKAGLPETDLDSISEYDENVCYEIDCLESAIEVMTATNFSVDPCNTKTWLNFACTRRVSGPDNMNQLERLHRKVEKLTVELLEDETGAYENDYLWKEAHIHFLQCKHKSQADQQDVNDIIKYAEKYGNWPIMTNKTPGEKFNWLEMIADLNRIERVGYKPYLLDVDVPDYTSNHDVIELKIGQTLIQESVSDIQKMLKVVRKTVNSKKPVRTDQIAGMVTFMTRATVETMLSPEKSKTITIEEFQNRTDEYLTKNKIEMPVNWLSFFQRVLEGTENIKISPELNVSVPFNHVMGLIKVVNTYGNNKDKKLSWAVANILQFQLVSALLQESTTLLDELNTFRCSEQSGDLESRCTSRVKDVFGYSLGATYLKKYYDDNSFTPAIQNLISYIKRGYVDVIAKTQWMQNSTKEFLKDKINHIKTYIGYPSWMKDEDKLVEFFKGLELSTDQNSSYPLNFLNMSTWRLQKRRSWSYKHLNVMSDWKNFSIYDSEWNHYPGTVQAQYHKAINQARIEAGAIKKPIFGVKRPGFMNFGGLGMILAHEIGHSFDVIGRVFNKNGEAKDNWDEDSKKKYYEWVKTIAEHYGDEPYHLTESSSETISPWKTINEDIADILAVYISYHSYQKYLKDLQSNGEKEKVLPGLKSLSPHKLFYMKYANMWCDNKDVQDKYKDMLGDHSSGNTRATLPLRYSKQFARAFGCKTPDRVL